MDEKPLAPPSGFPPARRVFRNDDPVEVEKTKANLAHLSGTRLELLRSAVKAGESGLKTLLIINGGAAVALLAFLGNVLTKEPPRGVQFSVPAFQHAMQAFVAGVALVGTGAVLRYLALLGATSQREKVDIYCSRAAILSGVASLVAFVLGGFWVVGALR